MLHAISFTIALTIVVVIHMVVGEMLPKNIAIAAPERSARLLLAGPHRAYVTLFKPVVWSLTAISNGITRLLGMEPADELNTALTVNEFHTLLEGAVEEGKLEDLEHELLSGALDFRARTAGSIMVPRARMVTVPRSTSVAELEALVAESGHSRIPVTGTSAGDVVGFVHSKDLLRFSAGDRRCAGAVGDGAADVDRQPRSAGARPDARHAADAPPHGAGPHERRAVARHGHARGRARSAGRRHRRRDRRRRRHRRRHLVVARPGRPRSSVASSDAASVESSDTSAGRPG